MDPMNGQKSVVMSINDILDELMSENKRLFNELLFANNCFNELKTHLINIHSKYQNIIDCEDSKRWDQLNHKTSGRLRSEELVKKLDLNTNECHKSVKTSHEDIDVETRYLCSFKDCNKGFKRKYDLMRHSLSHPKSLPISPSNDRSLSQRRLQTLETISDKNEDISDDSDLSYREEVDNESDDSYSESKSSNTTKSSDKMSSNLLIVNEEIELKSPLNVKQIHDSDDEEDTDDDRQYRCRRQDCDKAFDEKYKLNRHSKTHLRKRSDKSKSTNGSNPELSQWMRDHNFQNRDKRYQYYDRSTKTYICPVVGCPKTYETDKAFYMHLLVYHTTQRFCCSKCNKKFKTSWDYRQHQKRHSAAKLKDKTRNYHEIEVPETRDPVMQSLLNSLRANQSERHKYYDSTANAYKCPIDDCHKTYETDIRFREHLCRFHSKKAFVCQYIDCNQTFRGKWELKTHLSSHLKPNERQVTWIMDESDPPTQALVKLLKLNVTERQKCLDLVTNSYVCPINNCLRKYANESSFVGHIKDYHTNRRYVCQYENCKKLFLKLSSLKTHSTLHQKREPIHCHHNGCHFQTLSQKSLSAHLRTHTVDSTALVCQYVGCGKTFKTIIGRQTHERVQHQTAPTYRCGIDGCQEMFVNSGRKRVHQTQVHNRAAIIKRQYKHRCDWPGCDFYGYCLNKHKRVHTGERPYPCEWPDCDKRFFTSAARRGHMNVHTNAKPFACHWPGCNFRANTKSNVNSHLQRNHKLN